MGIGKRLTSLRHWLYLMGCGGWLFGLAECLPVRDDLEQAIGSNILGSATALIDAIFILLGNAILNPATQG